MAVAGHQILPPTLFQMGKGARHLPLHFPVSLFSQQTPNSSESFSKSIHHASPEFSVTSGGGPEKTVMAEGKTLLGNTAR